MNAHIHAENMRLYAEDATKTAKPWELWEFIFLGMEDWQTLNSNPNWGFATEYRRKVKEADPRGAERAALYREFCEWCNTVPHLDLDPRLHTHGGRIEDGGYISDIATAKAFADWQAARRATAAPQPQADALDAERWRFIKRKLCLSGNGDGTCSMQALNLPARIIGWPDVGELAITQFVDAAIDAAIAAAKENK